MTLGTIFGSIVPEKSSKVSCSSVFARSFFSPCIVPTWLKTTSPRNFEDINWGKQLVLQNLLILFLQLFQSDAFFLVSYRPHVVEVLTLFAKWPVLLFSDALFSRPVSSSHGWRRPVQGILRISIKGCCGKIFSLYFNSCFNRTLFFLVLYRSHMVEDDQSKDESLDEDKCHRHRVKRASLFKLKWEKQACPNYLDEDDDEETDWWVDFNCRLH